MGSEMCIRDRLTTKYDAQVRNDAEAQLLKGYRRLSVKRRQGLLAMID